MQQPPRRQALLASYLDGQIHLYELRGQYFQRNLLDNVTDDEEGLFRMVAIHLAYYSGGTWPEETLKNAIGWHLDRETGCPVTSQVPMMDQHWCELMSSGIVPWPVQLTDSHSSSPDIGAAF